MNDLTRLPPQQLLLHWLAEIHRFETLYRQINHRLADQPDASLPPDTDPGYLGQCPLTRLTSLQRLMHAELKTLLVDMEVRPLPVLSAPQRLAAHCRILSRLNQRAHSSLQLATTWPS